MQMRHDRRSTPLGIAMVCLLGCGGSVSGPSARPAGERVESDVKSAPGSPASATPRAAGPAGTQPAHAPSPESAWLGTIGRGPAQTDRVCARGARDAVASALCATPRPALGGLGDLHALLGVPEAAAPRGQDTAPADPGGGVALRLVGLTAHSTSLVSRFVSALNPRLIVGVVPGGGGGGGGANTGRLPLFAIGFTRGEPFVELMAYDFAGRRLNFYLLAFEPECAQAQCTPAEALGESFEAGWRSATLYDADDLANTPLDCLSCHQPGGKDAPRRALMRQLNNPWMHWMPLEPRGAACGDASTQNGVRAGGAGRTGYIQPTLFETFERAHASDSRYGGLDRTALAELPAGAQLQAFVQTVDGVASGFAQSEGGAGETHAFPSQQVLEESLCGDGSVHDVWSAYSAELRSAGLPVPFYLPDVLDAAVRERAAPDFDRYLQAEADTDVFELVTGWMSAEATAAIGVVPSEGAGAEQILLEMCGRCHNDTTDTELTRARFNVQSLDGWGGEAARKALERIMLPPSDPEHMPPRRFGSLGESGLETLRVYLEGRAAMR